jgi:hypothetical protein
MIEARTADDFRPLVGAVFPVEVEGLADAVELRLTSVSPERTQGPMRSFSLFFEGPARLALTQGNYLFHHAGVGSQLIFIVPIAGSGADRVAYQAVFTRMDDGG